MASVPIRIVLERMPAKLVNFAHACDSGERAPDRFEPIRNEVAAARADLCLEALGRESRAPADGPGVIHEPGHLHPSPSPHSNTVFFLFPTAACPMKALLKSLIVKPIAKAWEARRVMRQTDLKGELERMHTASFGWALLCCNHRREEAEEVLQTTYLKVLEEKAIFGGESSLRTWLFGVIRRTAAEQRRRRWLRLQIFDRWHAGLPVPSHAPDPEQMASMSETSLALLQALAVLSVRQREVLHLVFYQDLTIGEAAEVLNLNLGTARTHFERGKRQLRKMLDPSEVRP